MNYSKFRFLASMGRKLLRPLQFRKLVNYALYRLMVPFVRKWGPDRLVFSPPNIIIAVTALCNKKCDFCFYSGELNKDDADQLELTYEKFLDIINHPLAVNGLRIAFSGGEPLLNKDIFNMVKQGKAQGHIVNIITNGKLLKQRLSEILDSPPHLLTISYYPEEHEHLAEVLPLLSGKVPMKINFLLSKSRLAEVENVLRLAVAVKARFADIENMKITPAISSKEHPVREDDIEFQRLKSRLNKEYGRRICINWRGILPRAGKRKIPKCRVFWHSLQVDARGRISPCCQWPLRTYQDNIFTNSGAWKSGFMVSLRRQMRKGNIHNYCKDCNALYEDYLGI